MKNELKQHFRATMNIFLLVVMMVVICPLHGSAQEKQVKPGEYITEGGWGHLIIKQGKEGVLTFRISTVGANFHECSLEGQIQNGQTTFELGTSEKPESCVVSFLPIDDDIDVTPSGSSCHSFCGTRAWFKGLYLKSTQGCGKMELRKTRDEFKRLYDKKGYAEARVKLESILRACTKTLEWLEKGWILNDLAITQYKLHDFKGCLQTLQPLAADAAKTKEDLLNEYPPGEAYSYMDILDATRTNLKLCNAGLKK